MEVAGQSASARPVRGRLGVQGRGAGTLRSGGADGLPGVVQGLRSTSGWQRNDLEGGRRRGGVLVDCGAARRWLPIQTLPEDLGSEECFQAHPLAFQGATHTIRYNDGSQPSFPINATALSVGVLPKGSAWRRNPIPAW